MRKETDIKGIVNVSSESDGFESGLGLENGLGLKLFCKTDFSPQKPDFTHPSQMGLSLESDWLKQNDSGVDIDRVSYFHKCYQFRVPRNSCST